MGRSLDDKPTLLLVEDNSAIAHAVKSYGQTRGYEVVHADDGLEAVVMGDDEQPDVVLLDIGLPGLDGRDVLASWNKNTWVHEAVVIFTSARDQQHDRRAGLELGADEYESKPYHLGSLFNKIDRLVEKKKPT